LPNALSRHPRGKWYLCQPHVRKTANEIIRESWPAAVARHYQSGQGDIMNEMNADARINGQPGNEATKCVFLNRAFLDGLPKGRNIRMPS